MSVVWHKIATAVIRDYQRSAPVDVLGIADHLGLSVRYERLGPKVSGKLLRDSSRGGPSGYSIVVNKDHSRRRQRFTIAHEIAHFVLHRDLIDKGMVVDNELYRSNLPSELETQANRFAANVLMPYSLIKELMNQGKYGTAELADALDVSAEAMSIRLNRAESIQPVSAMAYDR